MDGKTVAVWFSEGEAIWLCNRRRVLHDSSFLVSAYVHCQEQLLRISLQLNIRMCRCVLPKAVLFHSDNTVQTKILRKKKENIDDVQRGLAKTEVCGLTLK